MIDTGSLDSLAGKHVVGPDGEKIGKVGDVYEATDGSGGTFATVNTGLFGSGSSFFPLDAAELDGDSVVLPFSKDFVKDAPRVEDDEELTAPEEERLFEYYSMGAGTQAGSEGTVSEAGPTGASEAQAPVGHDTSGPTTDSGMTRSEEQLTVGTEQVESGRARLRKYVVTENVTRTVPVSREEVRVEREPITDGNVGAATDGPAISEEEHEVVLTEERPVVAKEAVPVERVRLDTETVTEQAQVTEEVRKEQIDMDGATQEDDGMEPRR
ncbi:MAG: YsnF/AvaK domain-containing protein [Mycobacteriales bacterium]